MRRKLIFLLVAILGLSILPVSFVFAGSASCNGVNPFVCILNDAYTFAENFPVLLLGIVIQGLVDSFHFVDSSLQIQITNPGCCNVFTMTTTNQNNILFATDNIQDTVVTEMVLPLGIIMGVVAVAAKMGMKEFPVILGIIAFTFCALIWIKVLPTFLIIMPILFAGGALALIMSKFMGTRGGGQE